MTYSMGHQDLNAGWAIKHGIIGGLISAVIFAIAEGIGAALIDGMSFLMPLVAFSSVPLGAPPPEIAPSIGIPVGIIFHLFYTSLLAIIGALLVANIPALRASPVVTVIAMSIYGTVTWVLGLYVLAPAIGRPWFAETPPAQQFVYHTFFFGTVLGLYLASVLRTSRTA